MQHDGTLIAILEYQSRSRRSTFITAFVAITPPADVVSKKLYAPKVAQ